MKTISPALQAHISGEVMSVTSCIRITKSDGTELRLTEHDKAITVGGEVFSPDIGIDLSAIKSGSDLSVDNADIKIGIDGTLVTRAQFESDLFRRAEVEVFLVNWENTSQGKIFLKRGTIGDITIVDSSYVTLQLRGLTQALQRSFVELYSPTCRVSFGGNKCSFASLPNKIRKNRAIYKVGDWYHVPFTKTDATLLNGSFEANGVLPNGSSGITGWGYGFGSFWKTGNSFPGEDGSYYLEGGDDGGGANTGAVMLLTQSVTTSSMGMIALNIDTGNYAVTFNASLANTDVLAQNRGRIVLTQYNAAGVSLRSDRSPLATYIYQAWTPVNVTVFLTPGCRRVEMRLEAYKDFGATATVAFDNLSLSWWDNVASTFATKMFKVVSVAGGLSKGRSAAVPPPALNALAVGLTTTDGVLTVKAANIVYGVSTVTLAVNAKEIEATGISNTAANLWAGRIVWLSGANAGRTSFIRTWDNTIKRALFYEPLGAIPALGDKFIYTQGCGKTIGDCGTRFDNAINFRGEPFLPGPSKTIEFFSAQSAT